MARQFRLPSSRLPALLRADVSSAYGQVSPFPELRALIGLPLSDEEEALCKLGGHSVSANISHGLCPVLSNSVFSPSPFPSSVVSRVAVSVHLCVPSAVLRGLRT
jgi:hypothetical protein